MPSRLSLSRRGHYLLAFGVVQVGLALTYGVPPGITPGRLAQFTLLPRLAYEIVGILAGIAAVAAAFHRPPRLERIAFVLLIIPSAARSLAAVGAMAIAGYEAQLATSALAFLFVARVHLLVAGWPDPPPEGSVVLQPGQLTAITDEVRRRGLGNGPSE